MSDLEMSKRKKKPKRTAVEKLLDEVRRKPSPTVNDPRQIHLEDAARQRAFANLDREIGLILDDQ
jgi:hypothetical protein